MNKRTALFLKVFEREWNQRFRLVKANGTPLEELKDKQGEDSLSDEGLSEEDLQAEIELAEEIGDFLDEILEKEHQPAPEKPSDP